MANYLNHRKCQHLQFWSHSCFSLHLKQNDWGTTLFPCQNTLWLVKECAVGKVKKYIHPLISKQKVLYSLFSCLKSIVLNIGWKTTIFWPFKHKPPKRVNHTQIIPWLLPTSCLSMFDYFVRLALKGLKIMITKNNITKNITQIKYL